MDLRKSEFGSFLVVAGELRVGDIFDSKLSFRIVYSMENNLDVFVKHFCC